MYALVLARVRVLECVRELAATGGVPVVLCCLRCCGRKACWRALTSAPLSAVRQSSLCWCWPGRELMVVPARAPVFNGVLKVVVVNGGAVVQVALSATMPMLQRIHELAVHGGAAVVLVFVVREVPVLAGIGVVAVVGIAVLAVVCAEVVVLVSVFLPICSLRVLESVHERSVVGGEALVLVLVVYCVFRRCLCLRASACSLSSAPTWSPS